MKPPCMFTHAVISAASASGGARPRSRAPRGQASGPRRRGRAVKGQNVRAREQARRYEPEAEPDGHDEGGAAKFARGAQADDQRRAGRRGAGQDDDAAPPGEAERAGQQDLGQPFMRDPRRARHRMAERVGSWRSGVGDDPIAGRQMRKGVAVAEHPGREGREGEQGRRDRGHAKPGDAGFGDLIAGKADRRQGEGHRPSLPKPQ